jgi:crotonobetainyl-CoA:carnitine CoA-transferase CaiB-like acyl-CoA transferase
VATRVLADHGAEVIKVERRDATDFGTRRGGLSGNLNRGKRSIVLDMSRPEGLEVARRLVARCDVVVDNFSARVMPNWGLDYDSLRELNPSVVAVSVSGFGRTGPWRDHVSYGPTLQALTGFTSLMRLPGGEPAGWGYSFSDMIGGYSAALATLEALRRRQESGAGAFVDLSQLETLAGVLGPALLAVLDGQTVHPEGNRTPEADAAPDGIYRCAGRDRWCAITVLDDADWRRFTAALGAPAWSRDQRFAGAAGRCRHRAALDALVEDWTGQRAADEVMQTLQAAGVAAGIVADAEDLCVRDPQLAHRGYWVDVDTPEGERVRLDGVSFLVDGRTLRPRAPGPLLGEHTDDVLARVLGLDPESITALRESGAIG